MKLLDLALRGFRGAPDGTWSFRSSQSGAALDAVVVTGGPASGKTCFLQAIAVMKDAIGSYGSAPDLEACVRSGLVEGSIAGTWILSEEERAFGGLSDNIHRVEIGLGRAAFRAPSDGLRRIFRTYVPRTRLGKIELFPASRTLGLGAGERGAHPVSSDALEGRMRTGARPDKYFDLTRWLVSRATSDALDAREMVAARGVMLESDAPDSLAHVRKSLAILAPHLRLEGVQSTGRGATLRFRRADGRALQLCELSSSEEQALLLAGTLARIGAHDALVLLDTPELAVAPGRQAAHFGALCSLVPDAQVFAATSSPEIAASVARERLVVLPSAPLGTGSA